jgi:hypothetical protein
MGRYPIRFHGNQVDPTLTSQSIALADFSITLGSQTFYEASTSFSTSPSIQFADGQMSGLTFAFDPSASGLPYNSVSMSGGSDVSAFNPTTDMMVETASATATLAQGMITAVVDGDPTKTTTKKFGNQITPLGNYALSSP